MEGMDKLQHIYDKHAADFGVSGKKTPEQLTKLWEAIRSHLVDKDTRVIEGHYRGNFARLHYNSRTANVVVMDMTDHLVAAFKVSPAQAGYINSTGRLN
jgi:hypothetical protein